MILISPRFIPCAMMTRDCVFLLLRACLHWGGGSQVGVVTRLGGVTRLSIQSLQSLVLIWSRLHDRWGDPPHVTSPIWGPPPPYKQALIDQNLFWFIFHKKLVIPVTFKEQRPNLHKKGKAWGILGVSKIAPTYKFILNRLNTFHYWTGIKRMSKFWFIWPLRRVLLCSI